MNEIVKEQIKEQVKEKVHYISEQKTSRGQCVFM